MSADAATQDGVLKRPALRSPHIVALVCFGILIVGGYDMAVFGASVPELLHYEPWGLGPATVGLLGSITRITMIIRSRHGVGGRRA